MAMHEEQGGESIDREFNRIERNVSCSKPVSKTVVHNERASYPNSSQNSNWNRTDKIEKWEKKT